MQLQLIGSLREYVEVEYIHALTVDGPDPHA